MWEASVRRAVSCKGGVHFTLTSDPLPKPPGASPPPFPQALCTSQSSIVEKSLADANRARYESPDGRFDADAFAGDLATGRRTIALSLAIFPGSLNALALYLFFR